MLVHQGTLDSHNSTRINIFDVFDNSPPSSTYSDSEPMIDLEDEPPNPKKRAELYQWLNTSYYGSMIRKASSQIPYQSDYVKIEDTLTVPVFENEDGDEYGNGVETNSLLNEHKVQIDHPHESSTAHGSRTTETYALCKSCTSRYTRHRTTRVARIIWLVLTTFALSISFFPYGLFSVVILLFIPPQIRRPICKKCRTSFWGF
ncbi:unnamed protein product [Caenorhabditis brenneri]